MVFGWSSRPLDRRDGKPNSKRRKLSQIDNDPVRLTGSSIVMDDGDPTLFRKGPARGENSVISEYTT